MITWNGVSSQYHISQIGQRVRVKQEGVDRVIEGILVNKDLSCFEWTKSTIIEIRSNNGLSTGIPLQEIVDWELMPSWQLNPSEENGQLSLFDFSEQLSFFFFHELDLSN